MRLECVDCKVRMVSSWSMRAGVPFHLEKISLTVCEQMANYVVHAFPSTLSLKVSSIPDLSPFQLISKQTEYRGFYGDASRASK